MAGMIERTPLPDDKRDYVYADGIYRFIAYGEEWSIPEDIWNEMIFRYAAQPNGHNWTQQQVAQQYDIPRKVLEVIFRKGGVYKVNPAWSRERIEAVESESELLELRDATYEAKAGYLEAKMIRHEMLEMRKEVERYRKADYEREQLSRLMGDVLSSISPAAPPQPLARNNGGKNKGWIGHGPLADLHGGLYVWGAEQWGRDYDISVAADRVRDHGRWLARFIHDQPGVCKRFYMTDVGDYFHAIGGRTEHGTPLHQDTRSKKVLRDLTQARFDAVKAVRRECKELILMGSEGNHDHIFHFQLFEALKYFFNQDKKVTVHTAEHPQKHFVVGTTAHVLFHGYKIGKLNTPASKMKIDTMVSATLRDEDKPVDHVITYIGHLHEIEEATHNTKIRMKRLPAAAETDEYAEMLYFHHTPGALAFRLDERGRIKTQEELNFE
jgi:hypothetical protein